MKNEIIVLASKFVGFQCVQYLISQETPIKCVIVARDEDKDILELASSKNINAGYYTDTLQDEFIEKKESFGWLLNFWSPHILKSEFLDLFEHRLNTHPSLVPHCRGNDNAAWTIRKSLPAGVSLIEMGAQLDAGDVYVQKEVAYSNATTGKELHMRLEQEIVDLFRGNWSEIYEKKITPRPQEGEVSLHTRKDTEEDRILDANTKLTPDEFMRWALAHDFSPNTTAEIKYPDGNYKLTLTVQEKKESLVHDE